MEKKITDKDCCPCGSGKNYDSCCKLKGIEWKISGNNLIRSQIIDNESEEIFEEVREDFEELYGRKVKKNDFIFTFAPNFRNDSILRIMETMRAVNISEEFIYAFFKTDGILPVEDNLDKITDGDLKEFEKYFDEYEEAMNSNLDNKINAIKYTSMSNFIMETTLAEVDDSLSKCLTDFIHRHSGGKTITNFQMITEIDYCMFSALKTIKTLESVSVLKSEFVPESIYALGRSIFENYLYLCAINQEEDFFEKKMYPKMDSDTFVFLKYPDGKTNYNRVINKNTGSVHNVKVRLSDLKKKLRDYRDKELYDVFYQTACQFVHVDILSAKSYFDCYDPYDELNPSLVACVIIDTLTLLLLKEISRNKNVQRQFKIDCEFLTDNLSETLLKCLTLIHADKDRPNVIVDTLLKRLQ